MAAIDDLIAQIDDPALRERLAREVAELQRTRKFGLVFEQHLPELLPIYSATPRPGDLVGKRGAALAETWLVLKVEGKQLHGARRDAKKAEILPLGDVVVVRQFGDPIFPALVPMDKVQNGPADAPWHTLIEADNYHALQLLEYLYAGQVDCIYIDPPYNTGARDWKYNNDYVDGNDTWRHSKWLAMMEKRLLLAKRLLNPDIGVLVVTIDEHEVHHLGMLLEKHFADSYRQMVTIVINPKGVTQGRFSRVEEYAFFCFGHSAFVTGVGDDLLSLGTKANEGAAPRWKGLLRSGTNARRADRKKMFYPVLIDPQHGAVVDVGDVLPFEKEPDLKEKIGGLVAAWPIRSDKTYGNWGVGPTTLRKLIQQGYVAAGRYDAARETYGISYLSKKLQRQIDEGAIRIVAHDKVRNVVEVEYADKKERQLKSVWHRTQHDAGAYGADILRAVLGDVRKFSFPKSIYAVRDALAAIMRNRPRGLVVDFFAGSGTTLNSLNLLNMADNGQRRCILVTNNEVSSDDIAQLSRAGYRPGDEEWEAEGICQSVTWPRSKYTILGKRDDGTRLSGEYFTGQTREVEKPRQFTHIGFLDTLSLGTAAKKKSLVALIDNLPQSLVEGECPFIVSDQYQVSILFDEAQSESWLEALDGQDHIEQFVIVAPTKRRFDELKALVNEVLGPLLVSEEVRRPLSDGFPANLEYFRLDFLDKDQVALKRRFREILPLLWMRAGCVGPRPTVPTKKPEPPYLLPEANNFAVLLDEMRFPEFSKLLAKRKDVTHVFLVTDSHEAFEEMAQKVKASTVIQLYRDYLENFLINRGDVQ